LFYEPLAIETLGGVHISASHLLSDLGRRIINISGKVRELTVLTNFSVGVAFQRLFVSQLTGG